MAYSICSFVSPEHARQSLLTLNSFGSRLARLVAVSLLLARSWLILFICSRGVLTSGGSLLIVLLISFKSNSELHYGLSALESLTGLLPIFSGSCHTAAFLDPSMSKFLRSSMSYFMIK